MSDTQSQTTLSSILVKHGTPIADIDNAIKALQEAKRQARNAARKRPLPPFEMVKLDSAADLLDDAGRPLVTIAFRPFVQPSVDNGYGALIVASSEVAGRRYVPAGTITEGPYAGKVLSVAWSARIEDAPSNK